MCIFCNIIFFYNICIVHLLSIELAITLFLTWKQVDLYPVSF
jgi:hypothetical protein